jgi:CHAT domain-containing protein
LTISESQKQIGKVWQLLEESKDLIKDNRLDEVLQKLKTAADIVNASGSEKEIESFNERLKEIAESVINLGNKLGVLTKLKRLVTDYPGKVEEVLPYLKIASFISLQLKAVESAAAAEWDIGYALQRGDKFSEAIPHYHLAEKLYRQVNDSKKAAKALTNMGYLLFRLGKDSEAKTAYEDAIKIYEGFPPSEEIGDAEVGLGRVLDSLYQDDKNEAIKHYEIAENIFGNLPNPSPEKQLADKKINIGNDLLHNGKCEEAIKFFEEAELLYGKANMKSGVAKAQLNIGAALFGCNSFSAAIEKLSSALSRFEELGFISEMRLAYERRGFVYYIVRSFENAISDLENAWKIGELILMGVKSPELRLSLTREYWLVPDALSASYLALNQLSGNSQYLRTAFNTLELAKCATVTEALLTTNPEPLNVTKLRGDLIDEEDRLLSLAAEKEGKLLELASLRANTEMGLRKLRRTPDTLKVEMDETYDKLEELRLNVLLEYADVGSTPIPRSYNVLMKTLETFPREENWAVLEFALLDSLKKLVVFLIDKNGTIWCWAHTVDLQYLQGLAMKCKDTAEKFRLDSYSAATEADSILNSLSKELYTALMPKPIAEELKLLNPDYLVIVPHNYLHWIPFEAVFDGEEYWGLKYAISTAFSLDLTRLCLEKRKKAKTDKTISVLFVNDPTLDLGDKGDLEIKTVEELLEEIGGKCSRPPIEHEKATRRAVLDAFNNDEFDILHYAGHALFLGKDPSLSSLEMHTSEKCEICNDKFKPGTHQADFLSANEIIYGVRFKRSPIIYLSACETGISEVDVGGEMFGLVRALMYAGATSLVLSHWALSNDVAPVFAEEFYSQLFEGLPVAIALRNARRKISDKFSITDWAILSLHGDPFRKLEKQKS